MKTRKMSMMNVWLASMAMYFGVITGANAGGASLLHLPIDGVTPRTRTRASQYLSRNSARF